MTIFVDPDTSLYQHLSEVSLFEFKFLFQKPLYLLFSIER